MPLFKAGLDVFSARWKGQKGAQGNAQVSSLCDDLGRGVANYKITGAKTTKPRVLKMSAELTPHSLLEGRTDYLPANVRYTREEEILSVEKTSTSQDTHGRDWRLRGVGGGQFGYATFDMNVEAAREKKDSKSKSIDDAKEIKVDFLLAIREDDIADSVRFSLDDAVVVELPTTWDPHKLAHFILKYGTSMVTEVKVGYVKRTREEEVTTSHAQKRAAGVGGSAKTTTPDGMGAQLEGQGSSSKTATGEATEKRLERYERGSEDTPVTFVADALPLADLVRDNARSALLREAVAYLEEAADRWVFEYYRRRSMESAGLYSLNKEGEWDMATFLAFQRAKDTSWTYTAPLTESSSRELIYQVSHFRRPNYCAYVNIQDVRFEDAIAVGAKLCVTSTDGGDYLGIDLKRTTLLPEVFETRGFAGQTQGGSWKLSHPESAASRQRSFTKHFKVDCTKVEYVETSETIVHILTGARLEVTRRTPRSTPILSVACHYSTLQGARLRPGTSRWQKAGELTQPLPLTPSEQGRTIPPRSNTAGSVSHRSTPPGSLYSFLHSSPSSAGDDERPRGLSKYIEFDEVSQGPDVQPGHWVLTGLALLLVEGDRLGLQAKFSLLYYE